MLRRWLGIEDAVKVIDALDERYQELHANYQQFDAYRSSVFHDNAKICERLLIIENDISRKLGKDEFEGVNEEFRQLEDEFEEFKYEIGLLADVMCFGILANASKLRFLSRFIGATNKKGGGDAKV